MAGFSFPRATTFSRGWAGQPRLKVFSKYFFFFKILKIQIIYQKIQKKKLIQFKILKIQIIYQKIKKNKTNSIQNNIPEAGCRLWWYGRTLQSVMDYITAGDIPRLRYPQFEPRAPPDDSDDSSDDDGGNLEGDDYQYNGGGYEDYEYAYYTPRQEYD